MAARQLVMHIPSLGERRSFSAQSVLSKVINNKSTMAGRSCGARSSAGPSDGRSCGKFEKTMTTGHAQIDAKFQQGRRPPGRTEPMWGGANTDSEMPQRARFDGRVILLNAWHRMARDMQGEEQKLAERRCRYSGHWRWRL